MKMCVSSLVLIALCAVGDDFSHAAQNEDDNAPIVGNWLGTLKVPGAELRIAIMVFREPDGTYSAAMKSIGQGSGLLPLGEVVYEGDLLTIKSAKVGAEFEGNVDIGKGTFDAEFRQGPAKFPITFKHVDELPRLARPQEPKQPYPYHVEEVTYENRKAGITLAGTLTYPRSDGPFPAVILLTGSGPQNRDEEVFGHKPFLVLAVNGEKDMQVPANENLAAIEAALRAGNNQRFQVNQLEGLNHLFQTANTGNESEYVNIEETISPDAIQIIANWIRTQAALVETENR